ncbi:MAG TPA: hypothetical protein VEB66_10930 [Opitutaceae bacterium]|nr:hypothetical protein [Opitutaceae bacterium]
MADNPFTDSSTAAAPASPPPAPEKLDRAAIARSDPAIMSDVSWFWWIAGLSLINTVMAHTGSDWGFAIGLGFTLIVDHALQNFKVVALAIDLIAIGSFVGLGLLARKGHVWAFIVGAVLYAVDTLVYLVAMEWLGLIFHVIAVAFLIRGARKLSAAIKDARAAGVLASA